MLDGICTSYLFSFILVLSFLSRFRPRGFSGGCRLDCFIGFDSHLLLETTATHQHTTQKSHGHAYTGGGRRIWGQEQMVLIRYVLVFSYAWASVGPEGVSDFCFLVDRLLPLSSSSSATLLDT